jgi:hypothetical protein
MYFCPKCHFTFDIGKTSSINNNIEKELIKKPHEVFKKLEEESDLSNYKADFKFEEIVKNAKYKKLSNESKEQINKLFEEPIFSGVEFKCNNCNFVKEITETILLYEYDITSKDEHIRTKEENELYSQNPILPRTHDYNCKNLLCDTNKKNNNIKKEAVFFRDNNSFKVNYICCICYSNW